MDTPQDSAKPKAALVGFPVSSKAAFFAGPRLVIWRSGCCMDKLLMRIANRLGVLNPSAVEKLSSAALSICVKCSTNAVCSFCKFLGGNSSHPISINKVLLGLVMFLFLFERFRLQHRKP